MARIDRTRSKITKLLENLETGDVFKLVMLADMALSLASIADSLDGDKGDKEECNATSSGGEESIPVSWIEKEIGFLRSQDNEFAGLAAGNVSGMLNKWRDEQNERNK